MPWHDETPWAAKRRCADEKEFNRIERHIRTSATLRELLHWEDVRNASSLSPARKKDLLRLSQQRMAALTEVKS